MSKELFDSVAASQCCPGITLTADVVRRVWSAVCTITEASLLSRRSMSIPDLCHFIVQEELSHRGTWNVRRAYVPSVILAPSFTSISQVSSPAPASQSHVGTQATVQLNLVHVAETVKSGGAAIEIGRHVVASILRAIARGVAAPCVRTPARSTPLEFGFAHLEFVGGKTIVRWSRDFIQKFEEALGLHTDALFAVHRCASASQASVSLRSSSARGAPPLIPAPPPPGQSCPSTSARIPMPPAAAALKVSPRRSPSVSSSRSSCQSASSRDSTRRHAGVTSSGANPILNPASLLAPCDENSPRKHEGVKENRPPPQFPDLSPYYRQKLHKLDVRRQRKKAYVESWGEQLAAKSAEKSAQAQESRRIAEQFAAAAANGLEEDARALEEARMKAKSLHEDNVQAAAKHTGFLLPPREPAGDLFENRPPDVQQRDLVTLVLQRGEKELRRAREAEEDREFGQRLLKDSQAAVEEAKTSRAKRAAMNKQYLECNKQLASFRQSKRDASQAEDLHEGKLSNSSPMRFLADDNTLLREQAKRDSLVARQQDEMHQYRLNKGRQLLEQQVATGRSAQSLQKLIDKTCLLHQYELEMKAAQHAQNRAMWTAQMRERAEQRDRERAEHNKKVPAIFRNESSDDED